MTVFTDKIDEDMKMILVVIAFFSCWIYIANRAEVSTENIRPRAARIIHTH